VVEGEEGDLVEFMELMRTEFFETLNPRGRKLTTRLQERWPLDDEQERYEAALIWLKVERDAYRAADRADGMTAMKTGERERLEALEAADRAQLRKWEERERERRRQASRSGGAGHGGDGSIFGAESAEGGAVLLDAELAQRLADAGPPASCVTPGVYAGCGPCGTPPTREEIDGRRLFDNFTVFSGAAGTGYESACREVSPVFKQLGRMDGFDAMFTYRFS
jgi:hypothetical protein